jgi:amino acid adenylation domain-containing protein
MPFWVFEGFDLRLPALVRKSGAIISYADLDVLAEAWRLRLEKLVDQGVVEGLRPLVALEFETSPEAIAAYLGTLRSDFPLLLLEPGKHEAQEAMLAVYRPDIMLARDASGFDLRAVKPLAVATDGLPDPHPHLRLLLSTSGTTGDPKLVRLSAENIASNASAIADYLRITPSDRAITTLPLFYSYGMSVLNSYLSAGAALVLNDHSVVEQAFRVAFVQGGATSMALVPHQLDLLRHSGFTGTELPGLRYITQAGGRLDTETIRSFSAMGAENGWALVVMYGQTEAAPRISYVPPEALPQAAGTIGRAIPGGRLWIVDDAGTEITASGVAGELIYAGPNVMMGYATSRADFAQSPEVDELHTGDVAERTDDGFFRIVGRLRRFVKLFGLRCSLDQIETRLQARGIRAQAVAVDDNLVLLLQEVDHIEAARACLVEAFGIPASVIHAGPLEELPVLPSGKIDHRSLSRIAASVLQAEIARSGHETITSLAETFRRATRSPTVGPLDSFTSLGGDSFSYIEVQMAVEEYLGRAPQGWENMSLAELAAQAVPGAGGNTRLGLSYGLGSSTTRDTESGVDRGPPPGSQDTKTIRPVLKNQERYLLAELFTEATYGTRVTYRLKGALDLQRLRQALHATIANHQILRTEFQPRENGFEAIVHPEPDGTDIEEVAASSGDAAEVKRLYTDCFFRKPASFTPRELIRTQVMHLPSSSGTGMLLLTLSLHHSLSDAVTIGAYADEVLARYNGDVISRAPQDYAALIDAAEADPAAASRLAAARSYWQGLLDGAGAIADIPHDLDTHVALADQRVGMFRLPFAPMSEAAYALKVTPFVLMTALSNVVLARYSGRSEVLATFQSMGRKGMANMAVLGPFSNTLILRTLVDPKRPFSDLTARQRDGIADALTHESYPYHLVVRETGVQPRFGLNWFPSHPLPVIKGMEVVGREFLYTQTNYDLDLRFIREGDEVAVYAYFDSGRYSPDRIDALLADLSHALDRVGENPERRIDTIFDQPAPLVVAPPTRLPEGRLYDPFLERAREMPGRVALIGTEGTLTYGQLDAASVDLGRRLVAAGMGPGRRVAILAERGIGLVVSIMAVLRIGATMVPLDAGYPEQRLRILVEAAQPDLLLLPQPGPRPTWAAGVSRVLAARDPSVRDVGLVSAEALAAGDPDAPAYILFTSGSTGTPKGLATSHRPPLNFLRWQRETFGISADDRFTNLNGVAHDMMIRDIFAPLSVGAQLAIPDQADVYRPGHLLEWAARHQPTVMHLTPAMGNLLVMARDQGRSLQLPLRLMFFGGDRLLPEISGRMVGLAPNATIVNFYGTTETPQAASFHVVDPTRGWRSHPIGRGIENMQLRIVDEHHHPAPPGAPGEIAVLSPFLSLGYVQGGEIVPHANPGVYFTGDSGFELPSGEIMFTGRQDDQVSIRGYRIELEEVTRTLAAHPSVHEAQVLVEGGETPRLIAFAAGDNLSDDVLYAWMSRHLPHYMVPGEIVCLTALPLLPNGKLDRRTLLALPRPARARARGRPPETAMERKLVEIWKRHLEIDQVSPEQSFAELRGDSLTFVQVFLATEAEVGQLPDHWEIMPLSEIAALNAPPPRFYKWIDSAMLVRAIAIVSVVALHLGVFSFGGGSTTALFMVSGYFIGRLQLAEAFRTGSSLPFWRTFGRIFLPCALYIWLFSATKLALGLPVYWSIPTFTVNFVDYAKALAAGEQGHAIQFWYIGAFLQMLVLLALAAEANFRYRLFASPARFLVALMVVALLLRFALPGLFDPSFFTHGIENGSAIAHWPTTHLATLVLGMTISYANTPREKLGVALFVLVYALAVARTSSTSGWAMLLFFGMLVLFVPRLPIPKGLHFVILVLSGSSLFIYLTHLQVAEVLRDAGVPDGSIPLLLLALGTGVIVWFGWQKITTFRYLFHGPLSHLQRHLRGAFEHTP